MFGASLHVLTNPFKVEHMVQFLNSFCKKKWNLRILRTYGALGEISDLFVSKCNEFDLDKISTLSGSRAAFTQPLTLTTKHPQWKLDECEIVCLPHFP